MIDTIAAPQAQSAEEGLAAPTLSPEYVFAVGNWLTRCYRGLWNLEPCQIDASEWQFVSTVAESMRVELTHRGFLAPDVDPETDPMRFNDEWGKFLMTIAAHVHFRSPMGFDRMMAEVARKH